MIIYDETPNYSLRTPKLGMQDETSNAWGEVINYTIDALDTIMKSRSDERSGHAIDLSNNVSAVLDGYADRSDDATSDIVTMQGRLAFIDRKKPISQEDIDDYTAEKASIDTKVGTTIPTLIASLSGTGGITDVENVDYTIGTYEYNWLVKHGCVKHINSQSAGATFGIANTDEIKITSGTIYGEFMVPWKVGITPMAEVAMHGFHAQTLITKLFLPDEISQVMDWGFASCSGLTEIDLNKLVYLRPFAFAHCTGLTYVFIPRSLTGLSDGAFSHLPNVTAYEVDSQNPTYKSHQGGIYLMTGTEARCLPGGASHHKVLDGTTIIGTRCCRGNTNWDTIFFPASLTRLNFQSLYEAGTDGIMVFKSDAPYCASDTIWYGATFGIVFVREQYVSSYLATDYGDYANFGDLNIQPLFDRDTTHPLLNNWKDYEAEEGANGETIHIKRYHAPKTGYLSYGPYVTLSAGSYKAKFLGSYEGAAAGKIRFELVAGGTVIDYEVNASASDEGVIAEILFPLSSQTADIEFRVRLDEDTTVTIDGVGLEIISGGIV